MLMFDCSKCKIVFGGLKCAMLVNPAFSCNGDRFSIHQGPNLQKKIFRTNLVKVFFFINLAPVECQ